MVSVVEDVGAAKFGPGYAGPPGGIATAGKSPFNHRFGGSSWTVVDRKPMFGGPRLLLTLDLSDPLFSELHCDPLRELPLASYVGCDIGSWPQFFRIDAEKHRVILIERVDSKKDMGAVEPPRPFEERPIQLLPMTEADFPTTEAAYWRVSDMLLGGGRFVRVLGPPLWLYAPIGAKCSCGYKMKHVCTLGYETHPPYSGLIPGEPVFFGEMGLYWLLCERCLNYRVVAQST